MMNRLILSLVLISACKGPHVPGDYKGDVPITVVNGYTLPLCRFGVFTPGDAGNDENWLGTGSRVKDLAPGDARSFSIKPGSYLVSGGFCRTGSDMIEAAGTGGTPTSIESATMIVLGPRPVRSLPNQKRLVFAKIESLFPPPGTGGDSTEGQPESAEPEQQSCGAPGAEVLSVNDCCDMGRAHQNPGPNGQTAGEPYHCD
jgi:hypothetical protein